MLAFGCNTVFTFYTLYLSLCSAFFLFDWQIAIISSKMVAPTLRHQIAIRLARGMHLSSAVQADVSTCSGVVRLLLLSLQLRKPSGIGLLWVVGRKFLFFLLCALRSTYVSSRSLAIHAWLIREIFGTLFLDCFGRFDVFDDVLLSNPIYWFLMENLLTFGYPRCFWLSSVLCRTSASWRIVCFSCPRKPLGNLVHGDSSLLLLWFLSLGGIRNS